MASRRVSLSGPRSSDDLRQDLEHAGLVLSGVKTTGKELGRGSYGVVYEVALQGTLFAAKEIHAALRLDHTGGTKVNDYFFDECVYCSKLHHPNIVQLVGVYYPSPTQELPWLVMEMMKCSLYELISTYSEEGKDIPFHYKHSILLDVAQGLQFLHSKQIIHRDLSSSNVLLTNGYRAKIGDLGVAKVVDQSTSQTLVPGTHAFMSPEALTTTYGTSLDVFSFGCVCIHLVSLEFPVPEAWNPSILTEIQRRKKYLAKFNRLPPELKSLVEQCLQDLPKDRPLTEDIVKRLRNIRYDPLPHENDDVLQLYTLVIDCEKKLHEKEQLFAQHIQRMRDKDVEYEVCRQELSRVTEQLAEKDMQIAERDKQIAENERRNYKAEDVTAKKSSINNLHPSPPVPSKMESVQVLRLPPSLRTDYEVSSNRSTSSQSASRSRSQSEPSKVVMPNVKLRNKLSNRYSLDTETQEEHKTSTLSRAKRCPKCKCSFHSVSHKYTCNEQ